MHIIKIKDFFEQINIGKNYKKQILDHIIKKFSLMIRVDLDMFTFAKTLTWDKQNIILRS